MKATKVNPVAKKDPVKVKNVKIQGRKEQLEERKEAQFQRNTVQRIRTARAEGLVQRRFLNDMEPAFFLSEDDIVRGITSRDEVMWGLFRDLARADFRHDFGENVPTRDKFMESDFGRFLEIAKNIATSKGRVGLEKEFKNEYAGKNIFTVLLKSFDKLLVPRLETESGETVDNKEADFLREEGVLKRIGIDDWDTFKSEVDKNAVVNREFGQRSYIIRSSSYRRGLKGTTGYSENQNIAAMFDEVTKDPVTNIGKRKFALIIDASGGMPLTEILNNRLGPETSGDFEFYILENIENSSDSATKVTNLVKPDPSKQYPDLFFLKEETTSTVVYPLWDNAQDPKSNIFSSLDIVLNRVTDDEVEANLSITSDGQTTTIQIGDIANTANVKSASLYALATYLEEGASHRAIAYTLAKRMGDWCQALSLLDLDRRYAVLDKDRKPVLVNGNPKKTTLRDMMADTEIGIVTNDRILLAFSILMGLNVFYTTAMDVARLVYFKNKNDIQVGEDLGDRAKTVYSRKVELNAASANNAAIQSTIAEGITQVRSSSDIVTYIQRVKSFLSNVGKLRTEFEDLVTQYEAADASYTTALALVDATKAEGRDVSPEIYATMFASATTVVSTSTKIDIDIKHNQKTIDDLKEGVYPGYQADNIRLNALRVKLATGARIPKSAEVVDAKNILLGIRDDIKQVRQKAIVTPDQVKMLFPETFNAPEGPDSRTQTNYNEIMTVIPTIRLTISSLMSGGGQRGGAFEDLTKVFNGIRTRSIHLIPTEENTSTTNMYKRGDMYIDEKLNEYTVSDEFIVTKEDLPTFDMLFANFELPQYINPELLAQLTYILFKYTILLLDMEEEAYNNLLTNISTPDSFVVLDEYGQEITINNNELGIPGTLQFAELQSIKSRAHQMNQIVLNFTNYTSDSIPNIIEILKGLHDRSVYVASPRDPPSFQELRDRLIGSVVTFTTAENIVPFVKDREQVDPTIIERIQTVQFPKFANNRSYIRESVAQRLGPYISNPTEFDYQTLGEAIESPFLDVSVESETLEDRIIESIENWFQVNRQTSPTENDLTYIRTILRNIESGTASSSASASSGMADATPSNDWGSATGFAPTSSSSTDWGSTGSTNRPSLLGKRSSEYQGFPSAKRVRRGGKTYRAGKHKSRHSTYRNPI